LPTKCTSAGQNFQRSAAVSGGRLGEPGPDAEQLRLMLTAAARVPDHKKLAPWRFILFGSLARGDFHPYSDADIVIVDGGEDWAEAERAVYDAAKQLDVTADISFWESLSERVRAEVRRDGIACG
jgi:predicted nucleotidyltransferase